MFHVKHFYSLEIDGSFWVTVGVEALGHDVRGREEEVANSAAQIKSPSFSQFKVLFLILPPIK